MCSVTQLHTTLFDLWTVAHQAPLAMGFSRQKYPEWVAILFSGGFSLTQESNLHFLCLLQWQVDFTTVPPGKLEKRLKVGHEDNTTSTLLAEKLII